MAVLTCAFLLAASPAVAATSVEMSGGAILSVWEHGHALLYSVESAGAIRVGRVPRTGDRARDAFPSLALDPTTGKPVLLWSRSDGAALKIAYARFEQGSWKNIHALSFGRGDDILPLAGSSMNGSYLFFASVGAAQYMYAPLDLSRGRLFAAPRPLLAGLQTTGAGGVTPLGGFGNPRPDGGTDVPVVIGACDPRRAGSCTGGMPGWGTLPPMPVGERAQGITLVIEPFTALWSVAASHECSRLAVVIPDATLRAVTIIAFKDGTIGLVRQFPVPTPLPSNFGPAAADAALASLCR
jgi:hypothetical protein